MKRAKRPKAEAAARQELLDQLAVLRVRVDEAAEQFKLIVRRQGKGRAKDLKGILDLVASLSEAVLSRE
jgi:hypothetical protein